VGAVVIESLRPEMARVSQNNFAALEQEGMIVGRESGEASLNWQRLNRRADRIESRALNQPKTRMSGSQTAKQRDKTRSEERNTGDRPFRKRPARKQIAPQKRENEKVPPNHEFEIVPIPRCGLNKIANDKDHNSRQHKRDVRRRRLTPAPASFPSAPDTHCYQCQRKQDP